MSVRVLLIEDSSADLRWVVSGLASAGADHFVVTTAAHLTAAQALAEAESFDVALVDCHFFMGDAEAFLTWRRLFMANMPVVLLVSPEEEQLVCRLLKDEPVDCLFKHETEQRLMVRTLEFVVERFHLERELSIARAHQERLATHDALTGLPNRTLFLDRLSHNLTLAERNGELLAVLFIDLDRFKTVNDALGFEAGDELLKLMSERLQAVLRQSDTASRCGGDEYCCIISGLRSRADFERVAQKVLQALSSTVELKGQPLTCMPSIGVAVYPDDGAEATTLIAHAEAAMHSAKQQGRCCYRFFNPEMDGKDSRLLGLEVDIRNALERGEFSMHYQPIISMETGHIEAVEALIRWQHPKLGMVSPMDFIYLAEASGLIFPLGEWILHTVCAQNRAWQDLGLRPVRVAVNLSTMQFGGSRSLVDIVRKALDDTGLQPRWLELEITEGATMHNPKAAIEMLAVLREMGVRVAIDDFGTGYSSLSYLQRFPVDTLKIDRSFVKDVTSNPDSAAITKTIIALAHVLGMETVAEGVEDMRQMHFLRELQCHYVQGFLYSKPLPADDMTMKLRSENAALAEFRPGKAATETSSLAVQIRSMLGKSESLPVLSGTAHKLLELSKNPDAGSNMLIEVIAEEPALAAQIIRYANAPFFGFNGSIASLEQAVMTVLGFDGAMGIALGFIAVKSVGPVNGILAADGFWWRAVAVAATAQSLARQRGVRGRVKPGLAYLSGLLHNIGSLFLASKFPNVYLQLKQSNVLAVASGSAAEVEARILGMTLTEIGRQLLQQWNLPPEIVNGVGHQDQPEEAGEFANYARLVRLARTLLDEGETDEEQLKVLASAVGLSSDAVAEVWQCIMGGRDSLESLAQQLAA